MSSSPGVDVEAVLGLLRAAAAADGVRPVSEETELRLQHGTGGGADLAVHDAGELAGYARYDDGVAELVVHPAFRRRGHGRALDLTFKEFELLKYLAQHPGRVFSRQQLLQEVWGYDYFGGTRTVDVHVRRLRAKLGTEHEALIGTVRNVGYKLDQQVADATAAAGVTVTDTLG